MYLLKLIIVFCVISLLTVIYSFKPFEKDCGNAISYADDAYSNFRKSYYASDLDDVQYYAKKGMNDASDAESEANDSNCDCDYAESAASDAYTYGRRAYYSDNLADAHYNAKKAMNSADDASSYAQDCENE